MGEGEWEKRFLLLYGSQTGQADAIAEIIRDLAREKGFDPDMYCISQSEKKFDITKEAVVVVVVSTTGDGEAPDTVSKFWRKLKRRTMPKTHLAGVQYGLLGLGDTNYNNFCNMGKNLHRRMQQLGATAFVSPGWADDGVGLDIVVEPWIERLWEPLEQTLRQLTTLAGQQEDTPTTEISVPSKDCTGIPTEQSHLTLLVQKSDFLNPVSDNTANCDATTEITDITSSDGMRNTDVTSSDGTKITDVTSSDGTKITDVTSSDGTKITDTTSSDGTKITDVTSSDGMKNGTMITDVISSDGTKITNVTSSDGTKITDVTSSDGTKITDVTSSDGTKITNVTSSDGTKNGTMITDVISSDGTKITNVTSSDGTKITDVTSSDGTKITDVTSSDGTKITNVTSSDGTKITDVTSSDGTKITNVTSSDGTKITDVTSSDGTKITDVTSSDATRATADDLQSLVRYGSRASDAKSGNAPLSLPSVPTGHLTLIIEEPKLSSSGVEFRYHDVEYVYGKVGGITMATVVRCRQLTHEGALRKTIELELLVEDDAFEYAPGDAVSIVCPNPPNEVDLLLTRLGLESCADHMMHLEINTTSSTSRRTPVLPRHIPTLCSVRQYFTHCADFRAIPKKAFLMYLSSCCSSDTERRRLEELSSRSHAAEYSDLILTRHTDLLDLLFAFPSCQPTLDRLIEFLPKLKPRLYSLASSPLTSPRRCIITLSVLPLPSRSWWRAAANEDHSEEEERKGLASGYFDGFIQNLAHDSVIKVPLVPRAVNTFHLPDNPSLPIIMIGPGTGVAPFVGFLEHKRNQYRNGTTIGKAWLFFGCRHPDLDHIYRDELEGFMADKTLTTLTVCYSREGDEVQYVQDGMRRHGRELTEWVVRDRACVYVCGDAKGMASDVESAWIDVLSDHLHQTETEEGGGGDEGGSGDDRGGGERGHEGTDKGRRDSGQKLLAELKDSSRYLVDAWTS